MSQCTCTFHFTKVLLDDLSSGQVLKGTQSLVPHEGAAYMVLVIIIKYYLNFMLALSTPTIAKFMKVNWWESEVACHQHWSIKIQIAVLQN